MKTKPIVYLVLLGVPTICCLGGIGLIYTGARLAHSNLQSELAEARQAGMPLSMDAIPMPTGPEAQNAAPLYKRASTLLDGVLKPPQALVAKSLSRTAGSADKAAAQKTLPALSPLMDILKQLPDKPYCNFHRNWNLTWNLTFPEYQSMKSLAQDLCFMAEQQDGKGDWPDALKSLRLVHRISQDCSSDACLIGSLVQIADRRIAQTEYERLIARHSRDRAFLDAVDKQLRAESELPDLRRALSGEIAMGYMGRLGATNVQAAVDSNATDASTGEPEQDLGPAKSLIATQAFRDSLESEYLSKWLPAWKRLPRDNHDWAGYQHALAALDESINGASSIVGKFNASMMPALTPFTNAVGVLQAHDRLLIDSVALLKARIATGKLPIVLPERLGDLRLDPFDKEPLRYRQYGSGFILYSIGADREDNGGRRRDPNATGVQHFDEVVEFR